MSLGYSNDLYNAIAGFGLTPRHHVLDVGCGAGLASRPLIENGFRVTGVDASSEMLAKAHERLPSANWVAGSAEALPFGERTFDGAISAQTFQHLDRGKAIAEIVRVLKGNAIVAIWFRHLMSDDPVKMLSDDTARGLGATPPPSGLQGGFKEFYASPLRDTTVRVVPWHVTMRIDEFIDYETSRKSVRDALGAKTKQYAERLQRRLHERLGEGVRTVALGFVQFLYLGRTP